MQKSFRAIFLHTVPRPNKRTVCKKIALKLFCFWPDLEKVKEFFNLLIKYSNTNFNFRRPLLHDFSTKSALKAKNFAGLFLKKLCNKGRLKLKFVFEYLISRFKNSLTFSRSGQKQKSFRAIFLHAVRLFGRGTFNRQSRVGTYISKVFFAILISKLF